MQPAAQKVSEVLIAESLGSKSLGWCLFEISEGNAATVAPRTSQVEAGYLLC